MGSALEAATRKTRWRLIPLMLVLYVLAFLDRADIGFAKNSYQLDTHISNSVFALGAGIFFSAYALLGAPANLLMQRFGARRWIGCTTLTWGLLAASMSRADCAWKFLLIRTLLGAAEAGFFPGMIYLTSQWFPQQQRAGVMGLFYLGVPLALTLGSPFAGALLELQGLGGRPGWAWMFLVDGGLAMLAGVWVFCYLDDRPAEARFLGAEERAALVQELHIEEGVKATPSIRDAVRNGQVWRLAVIYMMIQMGVYGLIFFLPSQIAALLGKRIGFASSLITAIPWLVAMVGTYLIPRYSDRSERRRYVAAATLLVGGIGIGVSAFGGPVVAILALSAAATGLIAVQPVFWTMPTGLLTGRALAAGIGFVNMFGAFGGLLAPLLRVKAESVFANQSAGLVTLSIVVIAAATMIAMLKPNPYSQVFREEN